MEFLTPERTEAAIMLANFSPCLARTSNIPYSSRASSLPKAKELRYSDITRGTSDYPATQSRPNGPCPGHCKTPRLRTFGLTTTPQPWLQHSPCPAAQRRPASRFVKPSAARATRLEMLRSHVRQDYVVNSATTGAWSDGRSHPRGSLSIQVARLFAASGAETQM